MAIKVDDIPNDGAPPSVGDYPGKDALAQTGGLNAPNIEYSPQLINIRNISYFGHVKWTEPTAAREPRDYQVSLPGRCGKRYLVRLQPKRFCFDQSELAFGLGEYAAYIDATCETDS